MNLVILTGNVCNMYDNQHNVRITIADNFKDKTEYIKVTLFNNQANFARKFIEIGDHVSVKGRISSYKSNSGESLGITAHDISFEGYRNPQKEQRKNCEFEENASLTEDDLPWEV